MPGPRSPSGGGGVMMSMDVCLGVCIPTHPPQTWDLDTHPQY